MMRNEQTIEGLGAVLTYTSNGMSGVHGMTIGADGSGAFAVLFMGSPVDAENAAAEYVRRLERAGHRLKTVSIVANEPCWSGNAVQILRAPLPS